MRANVDATPESTGQKGGAGAGPSGALKEQLGLLSFLVLFAGLVSTETYYAGFGVRYQVLELPVQHLIYRGVTALAQSWSLAVAYLLAMAWLAAGADWLAARRPAWAGLVRLASCAVVVLVVALAYPSAIEAGRIAAARDLRSDTSTLPQVRSLKSSDGGVLDHAGDRLLLAGKDTVIVFRPARYVSETPYMHLLRREDLGEIVVSR